MRTFRNYTLLTLPHLHYLAELRRQDIQKLTATGHPSGANRMVLEEIERVIHRKENNIMEGTGVLTVGGTVFGAVTCDLTLEDNSKYHFTGYYADAGAGVAHGTLTGDFEGLSHILGSCGFTLEQAGIGPGGLAIQFWDFHGTIGNLQGFMYGAVVELGVGGGTWDNNETEKRYSEIRGETKKK